MLFTIWFINLNFNVIFYYKNSKYKNLFDDISIALWYFWNFTNMEDIKRKYNLIVNLSQFIANKIRQNYSIGPSSFQNEQYKSFY